LYSLRVNPLGLKGKMAAERETNLVSKNESLDFVVKNPQSCSLINVEKNDLGSKEVNNDLSASYNNDLCSIEVKSSSFDNDLSSIEVKCLSTNNEPNYIEAKRSSYNNDLSTIEVNRPSYNNDLSTIGINSDRSSSLSESGRGELPTCGSLTPIRPPQYQHYSNVQDITDDISVFYNTKTFAAISEKKDTRNESWRALIFISVGLALISPIGILTSRSESIGLCISSLFVLLSLATLVIGLTKMNRIAVESSDYKEIPGIIVSRPPSIIYEE